MKRIREPAARATLLTVAMFALAFTGTARASSTAVTADSANGSAPVTMSFPLERLGDLGFDTWLHYETEDGTAKAGIDYTAANGDVKVPAGSSEESISVQVSGAGAFAPDKQFTLKLLGAAGVGPTPSFAERVSFASGGNVTGQIKVADMNGDGKPDVIVPYNNPGSVSVLLDATTPGSATPSLTAPQSLTVGSGPEVATPRDVNGDGRPDLVVTNGGDDEFTVLLNTTPSGASTLSFAPPQDFEAGRGPRLPVLEDINGDGRADLVLANDQFDEHAVSVFFNTTPPGSSTVSFGPRQYFEFFAPGFVLPTDVNGDGRPDLVISSQAGADEVVVILNATQPGASNLSLGSEADLPVGKLPNVVRAADVNGDGRPDLVVANNEGNSVSVLLNGTAPGASTPSFAPQQSFPVGSNPRSLQAVDLNGDGRVDLVTGNHGSHSLSVLLDTTAPGESALSFATQTVEAEPIPLGLVTADLNGDGRQDLIYTRESNKVLASMNTTAAPTAVAPSLGTKQDAAAGGHPSSVVATDFNGDGKPDIAVANRDDDTASVLLDTTAPGGSTPSFTAQQTFVAGNAPSALATADFNLDGERDVVVADEGADTASVLFNTTAPGAPTPSFAAQEEFETGEAPSAVTTADFNGDGKPDLVVANRAEDDVSVLLGATAPGVSTPSFTAQQTFTVGNAPSAVAVTDVNNDGKPDVVVTNHDEDTASVLLNTTAPGAATPGFGAQQAFGTDEHPTSVKASDLNGDGKPDLVVANEGSDSASVLFNTTAPGASTPSFALPHSFEAGDAPSYVTTADLNGDGVPDLLVSNEGGDTTSVFLNTTEPGAGTPSFSGQQTFPTGNGPTAVTTADLNGDGGADVLTANGAADAISALLDTQYAASVSPASVTGTIHYAIPRLALDPGSLAFGNQVVGSVATKTVTVSNTGGADLAIEGIGISAADVGGFDQTSTCPPTLATGSSCSIDVSFTPSSVGAAAAALTVTSDAPTGPNSVALSGTGITPPAPTHMLTVELAGRGGGRVDGGAGAISCPSTCSHAFADGSEVTLTAIPVSGSTFAGWSGGGCAAASTCRVTVGSDTTVSARFAKAPPVPARLRIAKTSAKRGASGLQISVRGTIANGARGKVAVKARIRIHGSWVNVANRAKIAKGGWSTHLVLGTAVAPGSPINLSAKFGGSPGFHSAHAARRLSVR